MANDVDFTEGWLGLREDMAAHQVAHGMEPTDAANAALAAIECRRMELEAKDAKPPAPHLPQSPLEPTLVDANERLPSGELVKHGETGMLAVDMPNDGTLYRRAEEREAWLLKHIGDRVDLLMSKRDRGPLGQPSWRERVMAIMCLRARSADYWKAAEIAQASGDLPRAGELYVIANDVEKRYMQELKDLLYASDAVFGSWRAERGTVVTVG